MKAVKILECMIYLGLSGENISIIEVSDTDDEYTPQDEEWWYNEIGGCPSAPIESGKYLVLWPNDARDWLSTANENFLPDEVVETGDNIDYLYKLED